MFHDIHTTPPQGGPTCAVFAKSVPSIQVTVVDLNQKRIDAWNSEQLPIFEPNLADVVRVARDGDGARRQPNLFFTTSLDRAIAEADIIFVSVNTPTKTAGLGAGSASDLGYVEAATRKIAQVSTTDTIVVEKSTVPCRTAESVRDILAANGRPGVHFDVLSNPEFLAEGTAISDLEQPDRILIGSLPDERGLRAAAALVDLYAHWVPRERIITMNLWSSELAKLAANALLAQRISSINALSAICEATGAEIDEISYAVGLDKRIGPKMLKSSVGFGGSCFKKDVLSLVYLSESMHLPEVASYWRSVVEINEWQKDRFTKRIISRLYNTVVNKKVAIFGFAYKKNTGDTRESAAISIVNSLIAERAKISIYDPQVRKDTIMQDLSMSGNDEKTIDACVTINQDPYEACIDAHAVVIVTEWDEFKVGDVGGLETPLESPSPARTPAPDSALSAINGHVSSSNNGYLDGGSKSKQLQQAPRRLDWKRIASKMSKPMFVFDGRNIVEASKLEALGFRVECIGNARSGAIR